MAGISADDELLHAAATPDDELRAATEARAPPANEHNSSDEGVTDDHGSDDEGSYDVSPGAWIVLHSLQGKPALNGMVGFALEDTSGAGGESRWLVQLMPSCERLKVKPANFQVVAPADWKQGSEPERAAAERFARCILEAFADSSGPAKLAFPICESHHNKSRSVVHGVARDMPDLFYETRSTGPKDNRQLVVERIEKPPLALPPPSDAAGASDDLSLSKFDELCLLLNAMDAVPNETGAIEKRKRMSARFWRGLAPSGRARPRHARPGLFAVMRLLVPHHDSRRYGLSTERLAATFAEGLGIGKPRAKGIGKAWMLDESVALGVTGDVSLVLEALAVERIDPRRDTTLTVGAVNKALDAMQNAGKVDLLLGLAARIAKPREIKWLTRIVLRDLRIGSREYPKLVMDGLCRAKGRLGKPSDQSAGSPPLMYATLRYQNNLERVCEAAERGVLPRVYPPPVQLGIHVRAQLSVPCPNLDAAARQLGTNDVFIETKFDGFRFQLHWHGRDRQMRCFYRSGVECTADVGDLLPAVELALGGDPEQVLRRDATDEATRLRFTWLEKAWAKVTPEQRAAFTHNTADLVLDGELLVYDESMTPKGLYDELGTRSGIAAFGTNFWVRQTVDGKPSGYSREDARRHYLIKVFDVLRYNGEEILRRPLHERRELLESGRCFIALPHYLELTQSDRVDLASPEGPLQAAFDEARAAQAEGLMVKAAHQPYVPNGRTNVLKCKVEFIIGLGDTVTLLLLGARVPRTLGAGDEASMLVEFAIGARESDAAAAPLVWLFNTSALPWRGSSLTQPMLKRLYLCLTEGWGHRPALMNRLGVDEPPPAWMRQCPTSTMARPHWVLLDPESAPVVEVMGSRFLRRYNQDQDASSNRSLPWTIRFPRVARWFEETDGVVVDTVASFRAKAVAAFSSSGPQDDDDDGAEEEAPAEPLVPLKPLTWHLAPPSVPVEMPETSRWQAELRDAAPPTPASSSSSMPSMRSPRGPAARRSGYPGDAASKAKQQPFTEVPPTTTLLDVDEATRQLHKAKTAIVQCSDGTLYYLRGIDAGGAVVQPLHDGGERTHPLSRLRQLTGYDSDEVGLLDDPRVSLAKRQRRGA